MSGFSSYDPAYYAPLFEIEDRHFWFQARNRVISSVLTKLTANLPPGYRVLEVGCGTGNTLRVSERVCRLGRVVGMDLYEEGLFYAHQRTTCPLVRGDIHSAPFVSQFDLIAIFDVLEHLPEDVPALGNLYGLLAHQGKLLMTVPAHRYLWSYFDNVSRHCRRYELTELKNKLCSVGFQVEYIGEYMFSIFPMVWLGRRISQLLHRQTPGEGDQARVLAERELRVVPVLNEIVSFFLRLESAVIARRGRLPVGTSLLAVAYKK